MELFSYLLKVSACSALFFAFYLLVLSKLTFFKTNRFYLLASLLISFIIPALQFKIERTVAAPIPIIASVAEPLALKSVGIEGANYHTPILLNAEPELEKHIGWYAMLPYTYGCIVGCLILLAIWRLYQLIKHTKAPVKEINGLKLFVKEIGFTNCSFFNYVFIDENSLTESELAVLLAHEAVHAKQFHSIDKVLMMIAKAVLWFNPIVYLYDKALEQVHEYEADEATSQHVGTAPYANLLLKLAVSRSSNPLLHNFVKSPIKQRIKMLFNSKSKNMKKLAYLLALPIGLGLIWGFTVKVTTHFKPLVQQENPQLQDTLVGKTVKGKVKSFEKSKLGEILNLQIGSKTLPINCYNFKEKVKVGDEISVSIAGKGLAPPPVISTSTTDTKGNKTVSIEKAPYMISKVMDVNGKIIYELPHYAFLYEVNKARYAWSTIKSIEKNANGTINKIVLFDKEFTINLNVGAQQFKNNDFKKGDAIVVKFIGEKLTGVKTYTTDKMIAMYSWPKKYELINKTLFPKFYHENGRQKVNDKLGQSKIVQNPSAANLQVSVFPRPILLSSDLIKVDNKSQITLVKGAFMKLFSGELKANEVEIDAKMETITAKEAKFTREKGYSIVADVMVFNIKTGTFTVTNFTSKAKPDSEAFKLLSNLNFLKSDSIKVMRIMDTGIILKGNINMRIDNYSLNARLISSSSNSNLISLYKGTLKNGNNPEIKADFIDFDVITKQVILDNTIMQNRM